MSYIATYIDGSERSEATKDEAASALLTYGHIDKLVDDNDNKVRTEEWLRPKDGFIRTWIVYGGNKSSVLGCINEVI